MCAENAMRIEVLKKERGPLWSVDEKNKNKLKKCAVKHKVVLC